MKYRIERHRVRTGDEGVAETTLPSGAVIHGARSLNDRVVELIVLIPLESLDSGLVIEGQEPFDIDTFKVGGTD